MAANYYIPASFKRWVVDNYGQAVYDQNKDSLEQTGKAGPGADWLSSSAQGKVVPQSEKRAFLHKQVGAPGSVDVANLSDAELQDRLSNFNDLQGIPEPAQGYDQEKYVADVAGLIGYKLQEQGKGSRASGALREAANYLFASKDGGFNPVIFGNILNAGHNGDDLKNFANDIQGQVFPLTNGYLRTSNGAPDYSNQINEAQGVLTDRGNRANSQAQIDQLNSSLPEELARGRNQLFGAQANDASRFFSEQLAPTVMGNLNSRGILYSGDLESELNRAAGDVQSTLESSQADQISADDMFFRNAAYQQTFQREIQAGQDLSGQVGNARNQALNNQDLNFQRTQADLGRQYSSLISQRQNEQASMAQQAAAKRQKDLQDSQNQAGLISGIGSSVGAIGGAAIGGPPGAVIGGTTGGVIAGGASR